MGVLDDAIREHLELKRQHGAPQEEIAEQEQEALGAPVRRPVEPGEGAADGNAAEEAAPAPEPLPASEAEAEAEPAAREPEPSIDDDEAADPMPESVEAPPEAVEPLSEPEPAPPADEADWGLSEPVEEDTEPPTGGDTPPRGFERVEQAPGDEGDEEDVLEETPDFLQETPEHDRLWFEQKPPRDFDFDE